MKALIILISLFVLSCSNDPLTPFFDTATSPFNGYWQIETSGELPGAATIYIGSTGLINNGIPMTYYNIAEVNTYIDGFVKKDGSIQAVFYTNYVFESETDTINIVSSSGVFNGSFSSANAGGNYNITLLNNDSFSGTWQATLLE